MISVNPSMSFEDTVTVPVAERCVLESSTLRVMVTVTGERMRSGAVTVMTPDPGSDAERVAATVYSVLSAEAEAVSSAFFASPTVKGISKFCPCSITYSPAGGGGNFDGQIPDRIFVVLTRRKEAGEQQHPCEGKILGDLFHDSCFLLPSGF